MRPRKLTDGFSAGVPGIVAIERFEARGVSRFYPLTKAFVSTSTPTSPGGTRQPEPAALPRRVTHHGGRP